MPTTLLFRWFDEVWNQSREDVIDELVHPEATIHGLMSEDARRGPEAFREFYHSFRHEFTDIHVSVEQVIGDADHEAALCSVRAIQSQTGQPVSFSGMCMVHLQDGKIHDAWNHFDFLTMYQQLGHQLAAPAGTERQELEIHEN